MMQAVTLVLLVLLVGCTTLDTQESTATSTPPGVTPSTYSVRTGDTLYAIARRYNLDYQQIARLNNLGSPYPIYQGQTLRLTPAPRIPRVTGTPEAAPETVDTQLQDRVSHWRWPTQGKVINYFTERAAEQKGIKIQGVLGQAIVAVAEGKVVYSGAGIVGYGNLLVIQHKKPYLSIYGQNRHLLAQEGESVKSGQVIAEMGEDNNKSAVLYFEIRKNDRPVDPLTLLPRRAN